MNEKTTNDSSPRPRIPNRDQIAEAAERSSSVFSSLALMAEIAARVLKAVSRELSYESNFRGTSRRRDR